MTSGVPGGAVSTAAKRVRVAIVDDHQLLTASLAAALRAEGHEPLVPELKSLPELASFFDEARPDVTLLDLDLGSIGDGKEVLPWAVAAGSNVVVVSGITDESEIGACLELGACGWVAKSASYDELLSSVLAAATGGVIVPEQERDRLLRLARERRETSAAALAPFERLSPRESAVLGMLMEGLSVERIATRSFVSEATVRTQVRGVLIKLGVRSQLEAVTLASRVGWSQNGPGRT